MMATNVQDAPLLFLLHHAGGSSLQYAGLFPKLRNRFRLICVDLPGHGVRSCEVLLRDIPSMVEDVCGQVTHLAGQHSNTPYALFGHSMGGLLAYLTAAHMQEKGRPPVCLFVSSSCLPGRHHVPPNLLALSDDELWLQSSRHFGGISEQVLDCVELQNYFIPPLRADLAAVINYLPNQLHTLDVPVSVFYGQHDIVQEEDMQVWQRLCTAFFSCRCLEGNHFYLFQNREELQEHVRTDLEALMRGGRIPL